MPTAVGAQAGFLRVQSTPSVMGVPLSGTGCKVRRKNGKRKKVCKKAKKM